MPIKPKRFSIYLKTTLATFASVMVAFTILSLVYYGVMNDRVYRVQVARLASTSTALRLTLEERLAAGQEVGVQMTEQVDLVARASNAYVWLVRNDGVIIHATSLPETVLAQCRTLPGGMKQLPQNLTASEGLPTKGLVLQNSDFARILGPQENPVRWISVLLPVRDPHKQPVAVLQFHVPISDAYDWRWFLTNGVGVAFLVAVVISIALSLILMNSMTLPLEALAQAAHQVTLGDYGVRVRYSGIERIQSPEEIQESDEITKLMVTFNAMVARLEVVNAEQRDLISCLSHDMKTPLTSIIGFTEGILDGTVTPDRQERYLKIIQTEALRLKHLLDDLSQERMIESRGTDHFSVFNLQVLIEQTLSSLEQQIQDKQLVVQTRWGRPDLQAFGDEEQIQRVVYNLINNATKFCPLGSTLRLSADCPSGGQVLRVTVEDSGPGIPEAIGAKVFDRFYKLDKTRGNREGSGLGLYICRKILGAHGQQIYVTKSQDLGGARFVFTLPAGSTSGLGRRQKSPGATPAGSTQEGLDA